jgi:type IV pilus assembly protein PilA
MLAILFGLGFFYLAIVAGISVPAYQDYMVRAQVTEGLNLAASSKAAVAEYYAQKGEWPLDAASAGVNPLAGKSVESVTVANGSVVITYGRAADSNIADARLILTPAVTDRGDLVWICGEQPTPPDVVQTGPGPRGTNVAPKYLPKQCRPASGT